MEDEGRQGQGGQERGDAFDDLFEDLDQFFTPGESGQAARARAHAPGDVPTEASAEDQSALSEAAPPAVPEEPLGDDILPQGWAPDIDALDVDGVAADPSPGQPAAEEPPIEVLGSDVDLAPPSYASAPGGVEAPAGGHRDPSSPHGGDGAEGGDGEPDTDQPEEWREPTAEMSDEEWRRLRGAVGEEPEAALASVDEPEGVAMDPDAEEPSFEYRPEGEQGQGDESPGESEARPELTLEDLRKAPPEYEDLPAAPEEQGSGVVEPWDEPAEESWEEPAMSEVEAAADQLASEYRDGPDPAQVEQELLAGLDQPSGPRTVKVGESERLTGPTWEEPGSQPVGTEPARSAPFGGRNLPLAVLTGLGLAALALISLAFSKAAFVVVAGAVVLFGQAELYATMHRRGHQPATALGLVVGGFMLAGAYLRGEPALAFFLALGLFLSFLWYMAAPPKAREGALGNIASTMLGVLYVPFFAGYLLIVLAQPGPGKKLMLAILAFTFVYDTAAFVIGSFWGSRALASTISPRKSWEGLFGATVVTFALAVAILPSIEPLTVVNSVGLALTIVIFAPLGDLAESAMKRDLGVKDMGSILPGHGGILDRIDSVLVVAPAAFYYLRLIL